MRTHPLIRAVALLVLCCPAAAGELVFETHVLNADSTYSACGVMDVDRDGKLDVVCGGFWYRAPDWKREYLREVEMIRGRYDDYSNLTLDVNGDGWQDLVSANYRSRTIYWIEHPGKALGPWKTHRVETPGPMETARLADVDGDGRVDVLPNGTDFAAWWEIVPGNGDDGPRWLRHDLPEQAAGHGVGFGDVNGDGRGDVVAVGGWLEAPEDRRRGRWVWHPEYYLHRDGSIPILVEDVDADGESDLVWGRGHGIGLYWLEQSREGPYRRWTRHAIDTSWSQPHSVLWGDLDGDGRPELIAGKRYLGHDGKDLGEWDPMVVAAYSFLPETRSWRRHVLASGGAVGFGLDPKAADLDGDGDLDLVCPGRSGLFWLENHGVRQPGQPATTPAAPEYEDHSQLLVCRDAEGNEHPVKTPADWGIRRSHILDGAERAMGALPPPSQRVPLDVEVLQAEEADGYVRKTIRYTPGPGDRVPAYLLVPKGLSQKAPAMLCLHQTTRIGKGEPAGLGGRPTLHYAHELARRGYVCLVPDYPSFGDYAYDFGDDGFDSGTMKAIWNNVRAVDLLESLPEVHPDRIGCIGHSLGGHNSIFTAVFDQRIKAVVSSCGFTAFHDYYGGKLAGWTSDRYMPRIRDAYGNDPDRVPFDFYELAAALAPRGFYVNAPLHDSNFDVGGVKKVMAAAGEVYKLLGAPDRLRVEYPDSAHDFPDEVRERAYVWLDGLLK